MSALVLCPVTEREVQHPGTRRLVALVVLGTGRLAAAFDEPEVLAGVLPGFVIIKTADLRAAACQSLSAGSRLPVTGDAALAGLTDTHAVIVNGWLAMAPAASGCSTCGFLAGVHDFTWNIERESKPSQHKGDRKPGQRAAGWDHKRELSLRG